MLTGLCTWKLNVEFETIVFYGYIQEKKVEI